MAQALAMHLDPQVAALGLQHPQALPLGPLAHLEQYLGPLRPLESLAAMPRWNLLVLELLHHSELLHHLPWWCSIWYVSLHHQYLKCVGLVC